MCIVWTYGLELLVLRRNTVTKTIFGKKGFIWLMLPHYCSLFTSAKGGRPGTQAREEPVSISSCRSHGRVLIAGLPLCWLWLLSSTSCMKAWDLPRWSTIKKMLCKLLCLQVTLVETFLSSFYLQSNDHSFYKVAIKLTLTISHCKHIQLCYKSQFLEWQPDTVNRNGKLRYRKLMLGKTGIIYLLYI